MKKIAVVIKKELFSLAISPATYIAAVAFLVFSSVWYFIVQDFFIADRGSSSLRTFFTFMPYVSVLVIPVLTMGSWADEIRSGTAELLHTLPFSETALVLGKFCAPLIVFAAILVCTIPVPVSVSFFGNVDAAQVVCGYAGIFCFACSASALGQLVSLLTRNQITAFIVTALILLLFNVGHLLPLVTALPPAVAAVSNQLSFAWHFDAASKGIIDSRDIVFFAAACFLFLYVSVRILVLRKWS